MLRKQPMCLLSLRWIILLIVCIIQTNQKKIDKKSCSKNSDFIGSHEDIVQRFFAKRKAWKTSNLGSILFKNVPYGKFRHNSFKNKTFVVLIWSHFKWLKSRHIEGFRKKRVDPLKHCSVKNCIFTGNNSQIKDSDAVVVHIQKGKLPDVKNRTKNQIFIILNDESPMNMFSLTSGRHPTLKTLANFMFNWTMTFRIDADIPVPYGRTVPLKKPLMSIKQFNTAPLANIVPHWSRKKLDALVYVLMSNCVRYRMEFLRNVQKFMKVDIFGGCATNRTYKKFCRKDYSSESCSFVNQYLFYFVIENSRCHQYLSEKAFAHAYAKGAIPVILGPPLKDCEKLLPPNSFVHVDNFENIEKLAKFIKNISESNEVLREYHRWRNHFKIVNEHGYFGSKSYHYCRVCEALNYNDKKEKYYSEDAFKILFDRQLNCITSKNNIIKGYKANKNITLL